MMMRMKGFTLVELLVVITIFVTIVGLGLARFSGFNRRERLKQGALTLKSNLRFAQTKAVSGDKPQSGCTAFAGIDFGFASTSYSIQHRCEPEGLVGSAETVTLPSGVTFTAVPPGITFRTLTNGASVTSDFTITLTNGIESYAVVVSPNGSVSDQGFQ